MLWAHFRTGIPPCWSVPDFGTSQQQNREPGNISPLENSTKGVYIHADAMTEIEGTRGHVRAIPVGNISPWSPTGLPSTVCIGISLSTVSGTSLPFSAPPNRPGIPWCAKNHRTPTERKWYEVNDSICNPLKINALQNPIFPEFR